MLKNAMLYRLIALVLSIVLLCSSFSMTAYAETALLSAPLTQGNTQNGMVRVNLSSLGSPSTLSLTVYGSYTVNGKSTMSIANGSKITVNFNQRTGALSMTYNGVTTDMGTAFKLRRHETSGTNGIKIAQGRVPANLYPGDFYFVSRPATDGYRLNTIAYVYIEDYLYGVLPYEMGNTSGLEALKAQAVTARTYVVRAMNAASSNLYDVVDTTSDQVYSGTPSGNENCKEAVDSTKGIVAKTDGSFTAMYYTASNGGQVESFKNAWGANTYPYLKVKDDPYDLATPGSKKVSFYVAASGDQSARLQSMLDQKAASAFGAGAKVIAVNDITPHTPKYASPSRLYTKMDFKVTYTRNGLAYTGTITFDIFGEMEYMLGMSINSGKNELWSVEKSTSGFTVYARRYGHGVGMSQRGAIYMAQLGYRYDQILAFYFEGCTRVRYTFTRAIMSAVVEGQESQEQVIPENPAELEQSKEGTAKVNLSNANATVPLRSGLGESASVLCQLPNAATVTVYADAGNDYLVGYGILCGYINKNSLSVTGSAPAYTTQLPTLPVSYGTVINSNALNLRTGASSGSSVMTTIPRNTVLPILRIEGNWAYTQFGLRAGYVSLDYLRISQSDPSASTPSGARAVITAQTWLRVTASTNGYVVTSLPAGTEVALVSSDSSWSMVQYNKQTGYVQSSFINHIGGATAQSEDDALREGECYAIVNTGTTLNLRATPASDGVLMDEMPTGTRIIVEKYANDWCTVRFRGIRGYVMTKYLALQSTPGTQEQTPSSSVMRAQVTTESGSLNLRASASGSGKILCQIPQNKIIEIQSRGTTWCKTSYAGYSGYVKTQYLTFIDQVPIATTAPTQTPLPTAVPSTQAQYARVVTESGSLNLRATAGGMLLCTIPQNAIIPIMERGTSWCKTTYNGYTGFVMTQFLSFTATQPTYAPTQAPTAVPQTPAVQYARVDTVKGSLNLRQSPNSYATVLDGIPQYATIPILERGAVWCKTTYGGKTGYVMTSFLTFIQQTGPAPTAMPTASPSISPTAPPAQELRYARVTTPSGSLNLRAFPQEGATVLRSIPQGAVIAVVQSNSSWSQVNYSGINGHVMTKFLTFLSTHPEPQQTNAPTTAPTKTPAPTNPPAQPQAGYAKVTTTKGSLNVRSAMNENATVLRTVPQNGYVTVLQWYNDWAYITYGGTTGYVMHKFLTPTATLPTPTQAPTSAPTKAPAAPSTGSGMFAKITTVTGSLNLRSSPTGGNNILCTIPQYEVIPVLSKGAIWCQVQYNAYTGYVMTQYLTFQSTPEGNGTPGSNAGASLPVSTNAQYDAMRDNTLRVLVTPALGQVKPEQNGTSARLMKGCSESGTEIASMPKNAYVVIKEVGNTWCMVLYENVSGFCMRKNLEFTTYD